MAWEEEGRLGWRLLTRRRTYSAESKGSAVAMLGWCFGVESGGGWGFGQGRTKINLGTSGEAGL
jgi:hypothetical protein